MARTFRKKNYEKTVPGKSYYGSGFKINGIYTTWDYTHPRTNGHGGCPQYRPMTKQETDKRYWEIHGESKHGNALGPGAWYKRVKEKFNRRMNKLEIHKWVKNNDYEPACCGRLRRDWDDYYW